MRATSLLSAGLLLAVPGLALAQSAGPVAFVNATVVDVAAGRAVPGQTIVTRGDRIVMVGPSASTRIPTGARRVDLRGQFVIPGLWDMHTHVAGENDPVMVAENVEYQGALLLAHGVTGIRDVAGRVGQLQAMDSLGRNGWPMPRMVYTGWKLGNGAVVPGAPTRIRTAADIRASIEALRAAGATTMKLAWELSPSLVRLAFDECTRSRFRCVAHVPPADTAIWLSTGGTGSYEHLFHIAEHVATVPAEDLFDADAEYQQPTLLQRTLYRLRLRARPHEPRHRLATVRDTTRDAAFFARLASSGTWVTPTLSVHHQMTRVFDLIPQATDSSLIPRQPVMMARGRDPGLEARARENWALWAGVVRSMSRAGVRLLAGTDFGPRHVPGAALLSELVLLQRSGLTAAEALRTATINPAIYFAATDTMGSVQAGRLADLVVLRRNPLDDIANVAETEMVMSRGRLWTRSELDGLVSRARPALVVVRRALGDLLDEANPQSGRQPQ